MRDCSIQELDIPEDKRRHKTETDDYCAEPDQQGDGTEKYSKECPGCKNRKIT